MNPRPQLALTATSATQIALTLWATDWLWICWVAYGLTVYTGLMQPKQIFIAHRLAWWIVLSANLIILSAATINPKVIAFLIWGILTIWGAYLADRDMERAFAI